MILREQLKDILKKNEILVTGSRTFHRIFGQTVEHMIQWNSVEHPFGLHRSSRQHDFHGGSPFHRASICSDLENSLAKLIESGIDGATDLDFSPSASRKVN
jgi:hypothetical protein